MVRRTEWVKPNLSLEKSIELAINKPNLCEYAIRRIMKHFEHINRMENLKFVGLCMKVTRKKHKKFILFATRKKIKRRKHGKKNN